MKKVILLLLVSMALAFSASAQKTVTGKVTDADGKPVSGVSVTVKGTAVGTSTAADGTYSIVVPADGKVLEFSSVGFEAQTATIGNKVLLSPVLVNTEAKELGEVVVTGISKVKKSQYTGATTKLDEKQLKSQPVGSFEQVLQGRVPGVTSLTGSGAPGSPSNIIIRGSNSIQGTSTPLYVVDGIPVEASVFQGFNSNDFASIDILRDAASAALYGSRGSAGVIVVTTKRGTGGKMRVGYSGQMGVKSKPDFAFRSMTTEELLRAQDQYGQVVAQGNANSPAANDLNIPGFYYSPNNPRYGALSAGEKVENARLLDSISGINTNWNDQIFRNGNFSNHQITLSGGTGKTRLYSSIALYNEEGITPRTDMKRVTVRNNMDYADDKLTFAVSSNFAYTKRNFQQSTAGNSLGNPFLTSAVNVPYAKVFNDDGSYATGIGNSYGAANQLDLTKYDENYNNQLKGTLSFVLNYRFAKHFSAGLTTGVDFRETQNTNYGSKQAFLRATSTSITGREGFILEGLTRFLRTDVRPNITYRNLFKDRHDLEVSVYGEYIREFNKSFSARGYVTDAKRPNTIAAVVPGTAANQLYQSVGGGKSQNALVSGFASLRYTLDGKYTLTGSYRQDGSSKLPEANRWSGFYSIGGVWDATKEDFLRNNRTLNVLRLKLSYGSAGNADNFPGGDYPYQATYGAGAYSGLNTIGATYPGNPDLRWETTYTLNFGIDFEMFSRRLYGDINLYDKRTKDLFVRKPLSAVSGFGSLNINAGELGNKGVEVSLNYDVISRKDFVWTIFGNFSYNKNEVLSLGGLQPYEDGTELIKEGLPLGSHFEVKWAGVDAATGRPLYYDLNGNLTTNYSAGNRVQDFGTWEAPWRGGFGTSVRFKGFDLSVLFSWQSGANKVDNMEYFVENPAGFLAVGYNQSSDLRFWQKPGDIVNTPSPLYGTNFSSKIIHDASFMRLRELRMGYTLPRATLDKVKWISNLNFFVQGNNLFLWTKWRGRDPEAGNENINLSEFPNPRTVTAGIDVTF
jgi:TonB-linked SusC/RagA family outer membrane protein